MTASAHPLVFRPLAALLAARGTRWITARYAQTLQSDRIARNEATPSAITAAGRAGKARQLSRPAPALGAGPRVRSRPRPRSHELTITAHRLGIPSSTTFDYEWAWLSTSFGWRGDEGGADSIL